MRISTLLHKVMSSVVCYSSEQIPQVWEDVREHIKKALDRGSSYTLDEIYEGLNTSKMQLWTWRDTEVHGALVTTIQTSKGVKFCLLLAIGGSNMQEWLPHFHLVETWAKSQGCEEMRIYGRLGWSKVLDYKIDYCKMSKRI